MLFAKNKTQKNYLLFRFTILLLFFNSFSSGQIITDVARAESITFYGFDFSIAKFLDFDSTLTPNGLKDSLISYWSLDPMNDEHKAEIKSAYRKKSFNLSFDDSRRRNKNVDYSQSFSTSRYEIDMDDVRKIIGDYSFKEKGFGVLVVIETFECKTDRIYGWSL